MNTFTITDAIIYILFHGHKFDMIISYAVSFNNIPMKSRLGLLIEEDKMNESIAGISLWFENGGA